jgi:hypothetical protein
LASNAIFPASEEFKWGRCQSAAKEERFKDNLSAKNPEKHNNDYMRILIIIIFLLSPFVAQASTLKEMLALKSSNYVVLKTFYTRLKGLVQEEKESKTFA